jgi:hypothetical protein
MRNRNKVAVNKDLSLIRKILRSKKLKKLKSIDFYKNPEFD